MQSEQGDRTAHGPLAGLRVLDCSRGTAGTRTGGLFADFGADVVRVEPPGGDPWRPSLEVEYSVYDRGKRSTFLDLCDEADRGKFEELLGSADVLIESWRPAVAESLGLAFAALHERHPHLIKISLSGFGSSGRYRDVPGYEPLVHALVGTMAEQIGLRTGPIYEGLPFASVGAAYLAIIGALAALHRRADDGVGRQVETSLYDGALAYLICFWGEAEGEERSGETENEFLAAQSTRLICGYFRASDDTYLGVHSGAVGGWGRLMRVLGLDDRLPASENGIDTGVRLTPEEQEILHGSIHDIFAQHTREEWIERLIAEDICAVPALDPCQAFDSPQAKSNGSTVTVTDPKLGPLEQVALPIKLSRTPGVVDRGAPDPGTTDAAELLDEWQAPADRPWLGSGPIDDRPIMAGVKILDLGAWFAGPYSSRLLAELGADVIKLETRGGDSLRGIPVIFRAAQANKRALSIDLKNPELRPAVNGLLRWADIVYHNMRPGAAERAGISYEQVRELNPTVIYGHAPGWGPEGPYSQRQSFEPMMSGFVGVGFEVAGQFNPPLYPQGNADPGNGLNGAVGMLLCLLDRRRTGEGQKYTNPQLDCTMAHLAHIVRRADTKEVLNAGRLDPLQTGVSALDRLYETADGWLCLVAPKSKHVAALGEVLGVDLAGDPRFATPEAREQHDYELSSLLADRFAALQSSTVVADLDKAGVPAAAPVPYNNWAFMADPANRENGRVAEVVDDQLGRVRELAKLLRISDAQISPHRLAPRLGQHTAEILTDLGYDDNHISRLANQGAIKCAPQTDPRTTADPHTTDTNLEAAL